MCLPTRAHGELPDAVRRVGHRRVCNGRAGLHRGEPLVDVVVPIEQDVHTRRVQVVPQRLQRLIVRSARAVARLVPDGDHVLRAVGGEVGLEPQILGRAGVAAAGHELALAVEVDDVPVAAGDVVAVVARPAGVRVRPVVPEVAIEVLGVAGAPVVVARHRPRPRLDRRIAPRCGRVAVGEVSSCAIWIDVVAGREHDAVDPQDEIAGSRVFGDGARRDVAGPDEHGIGARAGVERPGRAGRRKGAVADGDVPLERLAGTEARPGDGVVAARGDSGVLSNLRVVATRERTTEVRDRQRVRVGIGDADVERR